MLKETIRQMAKQGANFSLANAAQPQLAGVSALEQKALLSELKDKQHKNSGYAFVWN